MLQDFNGLLDAQSVKRSEMLSIENKYIALPTHGTVKLNHGRGNYMQYQKKPNQPYVYDEKEKDQPLFRVIRFLLS